MILKKKSSSVISLEVVLIKSVTLKKTLVMEATEMFVAAVEVIASEWDSTDVDVEEMWQSSGKRPKVKTSC